MSAAAEEWLAIWVIYHRPRDLPGVEYAAREQRVGPGTIERAATHLEAASLDEIRALLPPGLTRLHRFPEDDGAIVETWL